MWASPRSHFDRLSTSGPTARVGIIFRVFVIIGIIVVIVVGVVVVFIFVIIVVFQVIEEVGGAVEIIVGVAVVAGLGLIQGIHHGGVLFIDEAVPASYINGHQVSPGPPFVAGLGGAHGKEVVEDRWPSSTFLWKYFLIRESISCSSVSSLGAFDWAVMARMRSRM